MRTLSLVESVCGETAVSKRSEFYTVKTVTFQRGAPSSNQNLIWTGCHVYACSHHPGPCSLLALTDLTALHSSSMPLLLVTVSRPHSPHKACNPPCADVRLSTHHSEPGQIPPNETQPLLSLWWKMCLAGVTESQAHLPTCTYMTFVGVQLYSPYHCRFHQPEWEHSVWRPLRKTHIPSLLL